MTTTYSQATFRQSLAQQTDRLLGIDLNSPKILIFSEQPGGSVTSYYWSVLAEYDSEPVTANLDWKTESHSAVSSWLSKGLGPNLGATNAAPSSTVVRDAGWIYYIVKARCSEKWCIEITAYDYSSKLARSGLPRDL
jgi:hypothetical protein